MTAPAFDCAIIGAGILGAATAWRLARAGQRVVVLEADTAASGATGATFAWVNAVSKEPEDYHRLNALGAAEYALLEEELGRDLRHGAGCLEWRADAEGEAALRAKVARLTARGYPAGLLDGREVRRREPALHVPESATVAHYPNDVWVDAPAVTAALLAGARELGAELREGAPVTGFHRNGHHVRVVETGGEWMQAERVAICAGTGTTAVLQMLGLEMAVERKPGLLAVTAPVPAGTLSHVVYAPGIHLRPDVNGGLRLGADDTDQLALDDAAAGCDILLRRAAALLGLPEPPALAQSLTGVRPVPADGRTVVGRLPGLDNTFVAVTHSGVTLGPLLGRLLAEEMAHGQLSPLLAGFRPERLVQRATA